MPEREPRRRPHSITWMMREGFLGGVKSVSLGNTHDWRRRKKGKEFMKMHRKETMWSVSQVQDVLPRNGQIKKGFGYHVNELRSDHIGSKKLLQQQSTR